jgi:hypothetical protein
MGVATYQVPPKADEIAAAQSLPPSTSTDIPQNVGWQFMGHMVRMILVLSAVMAISASHCARMILFVKP